MSIRTTTPEPVKARLRKLRALPGKAKASLYSDNLGGPEVAMQLGSDVATYGVWETLLYVEGYERQGFYREGAAARALATLHKVPALTG